MRLVDHHQAGVGGQGWQHIVAEVRIVQPFRTDQQHVEFAVGNPLMDGVPFGDIARVDRGRTNARALGCRDLVAHQRQQRRHNDRRSAAALPQQLGGDEVDRRLAPAGALHHQGLPSLHDKGFDRRPLVVAKIRRGSGELFEDGLGPDTGGGRRADGGHPTIVPCRSDRPSRRMCWRACRCASRVTPPSSGRSSSRPQRF